MGSFTFGDSSSGSGSGSNAGGGVSGYTFSATTGTSLTNLGTCIPGPAMYASSPSPDMEILDAFFAQATELPTDLADTDLSTFDSDVLGANGVVAYVPTYPLWSDGSGKLRHIRVPKGTSVKFDKATQTFDIPPNTRFYKTFFRKVVDGAGVVSNRKMETRLIVVRPDGLDTDGITPKPMSLFGTYVWSEDELTATLHDLPYRDKTPFADRTSAYVTNELEYHDVLVNLPPGAEASAPDRLANELLDHPGLVQHYAIPGSIRCVQCHRGSPTNDFVLGFNPLQIARRANGTGGTYEPTGDDELNQLQRLIDYGVISGMTSPADVVSLENSQLPRKQRTEQELTAQAYMIGNCAHCHNPRGYPSQVKPELASVLNFLPASGGGIFEFPLDRMSPVRSRGANGDVPMPYITPSLRDYPVANIELVRLDNGGQLGSDGTTEVTWSPKYSQDLMSTRKGCNAASDSNSRAYCGKRTTGLPFVDAPWRSLLYRNVDTPFPYFDDYVPFPHMPMNSPGFDCRAPRIMGDWMVSIPAVRKNPFIGEDVLPGANSVLGDGTYDDASQPYLEVKPDDAAFPAALAAAQDRLDSYHAGVRYSYCQDVLSPDIFDPVGGHQGVLTGPDRSNVYYPDPDIYRYGAVPPKDPNNPGEYVQPAIGVPYHANWFDYDPTDSPPPWEPRRGTVWESVLVEKQVDQAPPAGHGGPLKPVLDPPNDDQLLLDDRRRVVETLNQTTLTDALRKYATTELPYGIWQAKPECGAKLAVIKKVSDIASPLPAWIGGGGTTLDPNAPLYMMSPGASLYRHICFNCHGPRADGKGLQGDALAASSEGQARPANLSDGLFGPLTDLGSNLVRVFGADPANPAVAPDPAVAAIWGPRYLAWMALGGTLQLIPHDVIYQVEATRILGQPRRLDFLPATVTKSANMLNLARALCAVILPDVTSTAPKMLPEVFAGLVRPDYYPKFNAPRSPFVTSNGDWEMWMNLCTRFSPPVLRVYGLQWNDSSKAWDGVLKGLFYGDGYPVTVEKNVLDHNQKAQSGITADNYYPACVQDPSDPMPGDAGATVTHAPPDAASVQRFQNAFKEPMPVCTRGWLLQTGRPMWIKNYVEDDAGNDRSAEWADNVNEWTLHGAIATGMSVFSYLQTADLGHGNIKPYYNECQLLP
jgi:mono/diheme cytochrome c family protein